MSAVAIMLKNNGWRITGSDAGFFDPVASYLKQHNQELIEGHRAENIPADVDYIVIGKHAKLTAESNLEVAEAFRMQDAGLTEVVSFPELLSTLLHDTENHVVVGSYGKSTCAALMAHVLKEAGRDPSFFIGAYPKQSETNGHLGNGGDFILEGDEYPSSNTDARSKFMWYQPGGVLFTSGEHDHVNVFPTLEDYLAPYRKLFASMANEAPVVACLDNPHTIEIIPAHLRLVTYSASDPKANYTVSVQDYGPVTHFSITKNGKDYLQGSTKLMGKHNIQNIAGVVAYLDGVLGIAADEIIEGVASFSGVKRRVDRTNSEDALVPVYETYGSSYAKARSGIDALRLHFPDKKIVAVFEPHTFSWRDPKMSHWYEHVFEGVAEVHMLLPPSGHGKDAQSQLSGQDIADIVVAHTETQFKLYNNTDDCFHAVTSPSRDDAVIMLITSGDLSGLTTRIPKFFS